MRASEMRRRHSERPEETGEGLLLIAARSTRVTCSQCTPAMPQAYPQ